MENLERNISLYNLSVIHNLTDNENTTKGIKRMQMAYTYATVAASFIAIFTNILVAATLNVSWKFWRHSLGILLLTLACVDIIGNGICFTYFLIHIHSVKIPLILSPYLNNGFKRFSFLLMIPISVNRYALICRPFEHNKITSQKSTFIQITALTVLAFTTGIFELYYRQMSNFMLSICNLIINLIMTAILPLIITSVSTCLVIRKFNRMNKTSEDSAIQGGRKVTRALTAIYTTTRAMIATNVAFIILTFPSTVLRVICFIPVMEKHYIPCNAALIWLILVSDINFTINIFIYTIYLPKFRSTLFGIFMCKYCSKRQNESFGMSEV